MRSAKTQEIGSRTPKNAAQVSRLAITGRNPAFDYSFQRHKDIEDSGGQDEYGWEPVGIGNHDGEALAVPFPVKTKGVRQFKFQDTILCRRKKEITQYFQRQEDDKYNTQKSLIVEAAGRARTQLRKMDPDATIRNEIKSSDGFKQRKGPSQDSEEI